MNSHYIRERLHPAPPRCGDPTEQSTYRWIRLHLVAPRALRTGCIGTLDLTRPFIDGS
jgi:hypothetical protein